MSATANLLVPHDTKSGNEPEFLLPLAAIPFGDGQDDATHPDPTGTCEAIVRHYESRLNAANGVVLHLGAGRGELMETLRQHGFAVMGCEPSPGPTRLARARHGFDTRTLHCSRADQFLRWMRRIGRKAQAVFFQHEWEHNLEFQALLPRMADELVEGGRVIAVLPPPSVADYPLEAHLSFLNELALAGASSSAHFEVESVDGGRENWFMGFALKRNPGRAGWPTEIIAL